MAKRMILIGGSNERKGMAKKYTILIGGWGLGNTLEERKGMAKKRTILIDGWELENSRK